MLCTHLKPELPGWHINACNVKQICELSIVVIPEEGDDRHDALGGDQHLQFVSSRQLDLLDEFGKTFGHVLAKVGQILALQGVKLANCG